MYPAAPGEMYTGFKLSEKATQFDKKKRKHPTCHLKLKKLKNNSRYCTSFIIRKLRNLKLSFFFSDDEKVNIPP